MRMLLLASPTGTDYPDAAGIPEEAAAHGHTVGVIGAHRNDILRAAFDALPVDVAICWFANRPRAIETATRLEERGIPVVCSGRAIEVGRNQLKTLAVLRSAEIPVPYTIIATRRSDAERILAEVGRPAVCKRPLTFGGRGVWLADNPTTLQMDLNNLAENDSLLVQPFYSEANGEDLRLLVIGRNVVAAMRRVAAPGDFRANLTCGGRGIPYQPSRPECHLAIDATTAIGLDVAGVDLLSTRLGPLIIEVNPKPGNRICQITGVDMAEFMVRLAVERGAQGASKFKPSGWWSWPTPRSRLSRKLRRKATNGGPMSSLRAASSTVARR
jgi:ribosomal protein S6--L-glutamate ligase